MSGTALILAGHGSHISPETAGLVWRQVDAFRAMGIADEVTAAFWKEMPSFHSVLNTVLASDITVVPLFTAQGYFSQTVIPTEVGLEGAITNRDGRNIRYTRTLSEHPYLSEVVRSRAEDVMSRFHLSPETTAIAIIGHSTRRNPESRKATEAQAGRIRGLNLVSQVEAVYLDDIPEISEIYRMTDAPALVAIPFFLASGSHTTLDVPHELGLESGQSIGQIQGRDVYYTPPIGIENTLHEVILELAREAGTPLGQPHMGSAWDCFPVAGCDDLIDAVKANGVVRFGQLRLTSEEVRSYGDETASDLLESPNTLRERVRENPFRPLATSADLPGGWRIEIQTPEMLHAVVETIYPGAVADWAANRRGKLNVNNFDGVIERQTGNFHRLETLDISSKETLVGSICGRCVCHPLWFDKPSNREALPCPEPCNYWLSKALETME